MPISSLIIRTDSKKTRDVAKHLEAFKEVIGPEIHHENIVVVTETKQQSQDKALWEAIEKIPGVLQCDLIYHNFEE